MMQSTIVNIGVFKRAFQSQSTKTLKEIFKYKLNKNRNLFNANNHSHFPKLPSINI